MKGLFFLFQKVIIAMKAKFEQVISPAENSFSAFDEYKPDFELIYHYHPELELTYIKKSRGNRYVGGVVSHYEAGDLVLVGPNVPHCWVSETGGTGARATVIQFDEHVAGEKFWELPEMEAVRKLLFMSKAGILVKPRARIVQKMEQCLQASGVARFTALIELLDLIAAAADNRLIDPHFMEMNLSGMENERFRTIFNYIIENYQHGISLPLVAEIAHLTPSAFCRYFKSVTKKTLGQVVTEFRIRQACNLLRSTDQMVAEICFECGFGNVSFFNKTFKNVTGYTPLQYRHAFEKPFAPQTSLS